MDERPSTEGSRHLGEGTRDWWVGDSIQTTYYAIRRTKQTETWTDGKEKIDNAQDKSKKRKTATFVL